MPLLKVDSLTKEFPLPRQLFARHKRAVHAVNGVSFALEPGDTLGLVGESGSGKSTIGRCILRLTEPTSGRIFFDGEDFLALRGEELRRRRQTIQMVFQDPYASLDPYRSIFSNMEEPLLYHGNLSAAERRERVADLLQEVGLPEIYGARYPYQLSGGQRQRVGIARALALKPKLIVADEPVSALDVSVQAQILNLFADLRERHALTYVFISHDLRVVRHLCNRIVVLYLGSVMEEGAAEELFLHPLHPYLRSLLGAIPTLDSAERINRVILHGDIPSPVVLPQGCPFHTRCPYAMPRCTAEKPALAGDRQHRVACHLHPAGKERKTP